MLKRASFPITISGRSAFAHAQQCLHGPNETPEQAARRPDPGWKPTLDVSDNGCPPRGADDGAAALDCLVEAVL